jgi:hypothetical protein
MISDCALLQRRAGRHVGNEVGSTGEGNFAFQAIGRKYTAPSIWREVRIEWLGAYCSLTRPAIRSCQVA